jgi:ferredoxin/flavodoxin---NADP+ reductase
MAWKEARVVERKAWTSSVATVRLDAIIAPFVPGQFVNLALEVDGARVQRSYSVASPHGVPSEFYVTFVRGGRLTPCLFELTVGDVVWLEDRAFGFLTLEQLPESRDLWLMATGSGLAPFMSILRSDRVWRTYARVVLVHAVRRHAELGYREELSVMARRRAMSFNYVPVVSGAGPDDPPTLRGRIPALIASGELEHEAALPLTASGSHVLLCGNPAMIADTRKALAPRGLRKHKRGAPGHITYESYW